MYKRKEKIYFPKKNKNANYSVLSITNNKWLGFQIIKASWNSKGFMAVIF